MRLFFFFLVEREVFGSGDDDDPLNISLALMMAAEHTRPWPPPRARRGSSRAALPPGLLLPLSTHSSVHISPPFLHRAIGNRRQTKRETAIYHTIPNPFVLYSFFFGLFLFVFFLFCSARATAARQKTRLFFFSPRMHYSARAQPEGAFLMMMMNTTMMIDGLLGPLSIHTSTPALLRQNAKPKKRKKSTHVRRAHRRAAEPPFDTT